MQNAQVAKKKRDFRDIALDCTVATDEPLNIAVDSCSMCQKSDYS